MEFPKTTHPTMALLIREVTAMMSPDDAVVAAVRARQFARAERNARVDQLLKQSGEWLYKAERATTAREMNRLVCKAEVCHVAIKAIRAIDDAATG
jgi:hypothetical protein